MKKLDAVGTEQGKIGIETDSSFRPTAVDLPHEETGATELCSNVNAPIRTDREMYSAGTSGILRWHAVDGETGMSLQIWFGTHWVDVPVVIDK